MRGRDGLITAALIVAGIRMWSQLRGKATTPFNQWAIGWGATFFMLSLIAEVSESAAGALALIIAVSDFLKNGVSLTTDVSNVVTGQATGGASGSTFVAQPFSGQQATPTTTKVTG